MKNAIWARGLFAALAAALVLLVAPTALAADEATTWDLTPIFKSEAEWKASKEKLVGGIDDLMAYRGRLGESPETLASAFEVMFELNKQASRLWGYASMSSDLDTRRSGPQGMKQSLQSLFAELSSKTAWIDPELLAIPKDELASMMADPKLADYRRYVERLEKRRPHVLSAEIESILGLSGMIRGEGNTIATMLRNGEIDWPEITLANGETATADIFGYTKIRASQNRDERVAAYEAFYDTLQRFKGSLAVTVATTVKEHVFNARVRGYDSSLEASVLNNEVDPAVYRMLVSEINESLPTLHRYLSLRGDMLGIPDLRYHDMYPDIVDAVTADYGWPSTVELVLDSLEPLGEDYVKDLRHATENRWIDVYPKEGKRSGAYVTHSAYDVHPFMLLNHQDDYDSASTFAHEAGHLMHSFYSQENLPYALSEYEIFVAEVASTVNEVLFFKNMVTKAKTDDEKLALLGSFLEGMRLTVFRQTMFAEFELAIHEQAEKGQPLTGDSLNAIYLDLLKRYHGEAAGVMKIDDLYAAEWAFIPHFHYNFYVYQYATSYIAATALAEAILEGREGAIERYRAFLRSGSTKPPVELLKDAGVDMTSPAPIRAAMRLMNDVMDQIEAIRAKK